MIEDTLLRAMIALERIADSLEEPAAPVVAAPVAAAPVAAAPVVATPEAPAPVTANEPDVETPVLTQAEVNSVLVAKHSELTGKGDGEAMARIKAVIAGAPFNSAGVADVDKSLYGQLIVAVEALTAL